MCAEKLRSFVKDDPKVTDIITEDKVRKGFSDQASVNIRQSSTTTQPNKLSLRRCRLEARQPDRESIARHNWRTIVTAQSGDVCVDVIYTNNFQYIILEMINCRHYRLLC